jgi:hypothetical protein
VTVAGVALRSCYCGRARGSAPLENKV